MAEAGRVREVTGRGSMPRARFGGEASGKAAQHALDGGGRHGGEQADAVDAVRRQVWLDLRDVSCGVTV
ncbi:hypothetical protein PV726_36340 [Streptomyces europaeiscabiei]|uniref:hypothetical protein n=1 Tax=Streptomyces europaeiscabiei TaxID=146819 RepID=UPI0029AD0231|nr:hypothetical protein [Streptomyces europaeiscabiei]MDX3695697.1 hypothetical protein [Streptomyces europaeiscabiei]